MKIICVGKMKEKALKEIEGEYLKRLQRFNSCRVVELKEGNPALPDQQIIAAESKSILQSLKDTDQVILFDVNGKEISSPDFAMALRQWGKNFVVVIGGSLGFNDAVRQRANYIFSLSKMTFPHLLARIIILEQLFRGYKIINQQTYHK